MSNSYADLSPSSDTTDSAPKAQSTETSEATPPTRSYVFCDADLLDMRCEMSFMIQYSELWEHSPYPFWFKVKDAAGDRVEDMQFLHEWNSVEHLYLTELERYVITSFHEVDKFRDIARLMFDEYMSGRNSRPENTFIKLATERFKGIVD